MEKEIRKLVAVTARIEERTVAILAEQKSLNDRLTRHEDEDRTDFKEVHHRVSRAERKVNRSEEHTSELQSLMRISYAVFCLKKKKKNTKNKNNDQHSDNNTYHTKKN